MKKVVPALCVLQEEIRILVRFFSRDRRKPLSINELARALEARSRLLAFVMPDAPADIREQLCQWDERLRNRYEKHKLPALSKAIKKAAIGKLRGLSEFEAGARRKACIDVETLCKIANLPARTFASRPMRAAQEKMMH